MKIPSVLEHPLVDKDGNLTQPWKLAFAQLLTQLQKNLSDEGFVIPQQSSANISILNNAKSTGALIYDADTHELKINLNGIFKTIQTA